MEADAPAEPFEPEADLILGGGLYPQPGVESRYEAAVKLFEQRHPLAVDGSRKSADEVANSTRKHDTAAE